MRRSGFRQSSIHSYRHWATLPAHVAKATVVRESEESVIEEHNAPDVDVELCWLVACPNPYKSTLFVHRYFVVAQIKGEWVCSSVDETISAMLIEQAKAYLESHQPAEIEQEVGA